MRRLMTVVAAVVVLSLSLAAAGAARARTPTPSPTATVTPTPPSVVPSDAARFDINLWVDGRQDWQSEIVAKIGDVVCGGETQEPISPVDSGVVQHFVSVQSDTSMTGCGKPGAVITFFVDGRKVDRIAAWSPEQNKRVVLTDGPKWMPGAFESLTFIVGPSFARVWGHADLHLSTGRERVVPFFGDTACGYQENAWQGEAPPYGYAVAVYSRETEPGCGYEGATITFKEIDATGEIIGTAKETATWHAWDGTPDTMQVVDLTFASATVLSVGSMGTGDSQTPGGTPVVATALALAGIAACAAGAMLRARARQDLSSHMS